MLSNYLVNSSIELNQRLDQITITNRYYELYVNIPTIQDPEPGDGDDEDDKKKKDKDKDSKKDGKKDKEEKKENGDKK